MTIRKRELHRDRDEHGGGHRPAWLTLDTWACLSVSGGQPIPLGLRGRRHGWPWRTAVPATVSSEPEAIELVANVGLGFLFLLAGYELELDHFRERAGRLAVAGWFVSAVVSIVVTGLLAAAGLVHAFVPVALALTTTALGTLLPILRDNDMLGGPLGRNILPAGAVGEFLPDRGHRGLPRVPTVACSAWSRSW